MPRAKKSAVRWDGAGMVQTSNLLCTLVNPGTDETDLVRREGLDSGFVVQRRHPIILLFGGVGHGLDDQTVCAVTGLDNLPFFGALEHAFKGIHVQPGLGLVAAMAFDAGGV